MLIGYARVSKADGSQSLDLQRDALQASTPSTSTTTSRPASATTAPARSPRGTNPLLGREGPLIASEVGPIF